MKKVKWLNVIKSILFIFCVYMILHDLYIVTIKSYITGNMYGWSWLGFITFILFCVVASMIYEDFKEQTKRVETLNTHTVTTQVNN